MRGDGEGREGDEGRWGGENKKDGGQVCQENR